MLGTHKVGPPDDGGCNLVAEHGEFNGQLLVVVPGKAEQIKDSGEYNGADSTGARKKLGKLL